MTFNCSAVDIPQTLRWFFNGDTFALYTFIPDDEYPLTVQPLGGTPYAQVGGVDMQILEASPNEDNQDIISVWSSMKIDNISVLLEEGVSTIGCGTLTRMEEVNISFNSSNG